jgi:hypothetical protein
MKLTPQVYWSRADKGFVIESCSAKYTSFWNSIRFGTPMDIQLTERALDGKHAGKVREGRKESSLS